MKVQNIRKTATKEAIEEAFTELLRKKKLVDVTIKNITQLASVNRATFYAHYEDKYHLFDEMMKNSANKLIHVHTRDSQQWGKEHISSLFKAAVEYLQQVKSGCPYSYLDLFPLLRTKMLQALKTHLLSIHSLDKFSGIEAFRTIFYSRMIYDAAEILVTEETDLSHIEIVTELSSIIFNEAN